MKLREAYYAVRVAIEQAVYELITEGQRKGLWSYKRPEDKLSEVKTVAPPVPEVKAEIPKSSTGATMKLREASYVYKDPDERSQRTWMLKENTELAVTPGSNGWVAVQDSAGR